MHTLRNTLALAAASLLLIGLSACGSGSGSSDTVEHDHSAHEGASPMAPMDAGTDGHDGHDDHAGDAGMTMAGDMALKKIEPSSDYPLTTCVVTGEALGGMGDVIAYEVGGQEVQFCCAGCVDDFKESPEAFLAQVREAASR